jgi:hypothetical protein
LTADSFCNSVMARAWIRAWGQVGVSDGIGWR